MRREAQLREAFELRVRGRVQGVGFRPTVWRMAHALGLDGEVRNDADGVLIRLAGAPEEIENFRSKLEREPPPLARIDSIAVSDFAGAIARGFAIVESAVGPVHTQISPDAAICDACAADVADPANRRFGYALTNCTHCGPRLSILGAVPYDRRNTTMAPYPMCAACLAEYGDPANRRFHAEPTACPDCGPMVECLATDGSRGETQDPIGWAAGMLRGGAIVAIKGIGGYQLACDATNAASVAALRAKKRRDGKPFALMARDMAAVRRYCEVSVLEACELCSAQAPIVLLAARAASRLPEGISPGLSTLGFMLPTTPLHVLLLKAFDTPLVMTSGNISDEPQIIDDEAVVQLGTIASHILRHNRGIANRIDDSVVRVMHGAPRLVRRARGYAPAPIALPDGFQDAPDILALGGELKSTFCLVKDGAAILSQHQGDLEHAAAFDDYRKNLSLYRDLFDHAPRAVAADLHPEYLSSKLARTMREPVIGVQHHHAHVASCLCENGYPLDAPPVLGIALDGLGWGTDGTFWGGEFLLADYAGFRRLGCLKPIAMPGGGQSVREPWRNLYAHIAASMGWDAFCAAFGKLDTRAFLETKPLKTLDAMMVQNIHAPLASSAGRLFDAVAAALHLCAERQSYEGEAAARLEAMSEIQGDGSPYIFALSDDEHPSGLCILDPAPMWQKLFSDLADEIPPARIAARFHYGFAAAIAAAAGMFCERESVRTVALSGGCFQNRVLFERTVQLLGSVGLRVLTHSQVPANDGGLALGQAAIAAAQCIREGMR